MGETPTRIVIAAKITDGIDGINPQLVKNCNSEITNVAWKQQIIAFTDAVIVKI